MNLVNMQGVVLIGPGSEWFWTMLSGLVLTLTFVAIYRQLRAQRAASIFAQFNTIAAQWDTKAFRYARLYALLDLEHRAVTDGAPASAMTVAMWFEVLGLQVRRGHVDGRDVATTYAEATLSWWTVLKPFIEHDRARWAAPAHLEDFEALALRMAAGWERMFGRPYEEIEPIQDRIERLTRALMRDRDAERGVIPERRAEPSRAASLTDQAESPAT